MNQKQIQAYSASLFLQNLKRTKSQCNTLFEAILNALDLTLPGYMTEVSNEQHVEDVAFIFTRITHANGELRADWENIVMELPTPVLQLVVNNG